MNRIFSITILLGLLCCIKAAPVNNIYDVIVIGGGVSGLTTMAALANQYNITNTLLIEGSNRLGGRILTIPFGNDSHIEIGAQWVHGGSMENPLYVIMKLINQTLNYTFYGGSDTILASTQNGVRISESLFSQVWSDLDTIFNDLEDDDSLQDVNTTVSFGALLDEKFQTLVQENANYTANIDIVSAIYKTYKQDQVSNFVCSSFYNLSAQWVFYDDNYDGEEDVNLRDGFYTLIDYLKSFFNETSQIILNERVMQIDWSQADKSNNETIVIHTSDAKTGANHSYMAKHIVVSVSLNVLKYTPGLFNPPLPESKRTSIENLEMGVNNKLFYVFESDVFTGSNADLTGISFEWSNNQTGFSLPSDANCYLSSKNFYKSFAVFRVPPLNPNVLYSEFIGDPSFLSELTTDECLISYFEDLLDRFYPNITFPNIKEIVRSKWATNPLIQGAYTYVPPGSSIEDIVNIGEPLNKINRIYFVGEHTSNHTGTVHGALESGANAAELINEQLNGDESGLIAKIVELIKEIFSKIIEFFKSLLNAIGL